MADQLSRVDTLLVLGVVDCDFVAPFPKSLAALQDVCKTWLLCAHSWEVPWFRLVLTSMKNSFTVKRYRMPVL